MIDTHNATNAPEQDGQAKQIIRFTMGRYRLPCSYYVTGDGDTAVAHVTLFDGTRFRASAGPWRAFIARFQGNIPHIFGGGNDKGDWYLRTVVKGRTTTLAQALYGEEFPGHHLRYRNRDTWDLTRANLHPIDRKAAAAEAKARGVA